MHIIRPIRNEDTPAIIKLAFQARVGITNLPKNESRLKQLVEKSVDAFDHFSKTPKTDLYLFVLENLETGQVGGVSGIYAKTGISFPLYYYKINSFPVEKEFEQMPDNLEILDVIEYESGPSEICSLYLAPEFRKEGLGRLLSFSRLLFVACFPKSFYHTIFAEMRGFIKDNEESPFWNGVGRHFLDIDFRTLMAWRDNGVRVLPHILPKHPIYVCLLDPEAASCIGKVHKNTEPALHMLFQQGFKFSQEIDLFDGGPRIIAKRDQIETIRTSATAKVAAVKELAASATSAMISNERLDYRACMAGIKIEDKERVILDQKTAAKLQVEVGDAVRYVVSRNYE